MFGKHHNWTRPLLIAIVVLAQGACSSLPTNDFDKPEVELLSLRPIAADGMEARFAIKLRVLNPNSVALDIEGIFFEVFLREQRVLSGVSSRPARVPAFGEGTVELEASIGLLNSVRLIRDLASEPAKEGLPYRLKTKLSVRNISRSVRIEREGVLQP